MSQFDNWPSKSKLRKRVWTLSFDLRGLIFWISPTFIIKEINVRTRLSTSYHVSDTLGSPDQISSTTQENYNGNVFFCFILHVVSKHQRLVLQTMTHGWNPKAWIMRNIRDGKWNNSSWIKWGYVSRENLIKPHSLTSNKQTACFFKRMSVNSESYLELNLLSSELEISNYIWFLFFSLFDIAKM